MPRRAGIVLVFINMLIPSAARAADARVDRLAAVVREWDVTGRFRGAVHVRADGNTLFDATVGPPDAETRISSDDTRFRIGSVSKVFVAAAALRLEEQGLLRLEDPVASWLPEYPSANLQSEGHSALLRHLMEHTSGVPRAEFTWALFGDAWRGIVGVDDSMSVIKDRALTSVPGTHVVYNNTGYDLLTLAVERAAQQPFEKYLSSSLLDETEQGAIGITIPAGKSLAPGRFPAGVAQVSTAILFGTDLSRVPGSAGSGNMFGTAPALAHWLERLLRNGTVLSPSAVQKMLTVREGDQGLGLVIDRKDGHRRITHGGTILGYVADVEYFPDEQTTIAIVGNVDEASGDMRDFSFAVRGAALGSKWPTPAVRKMSPAERFSSLVRAMVLAAFLGRGVVAFAFQGGVILWMLGILVRATNASRLHVAQEIAAGSAVIAILISLSDPPSVLSAVVACAFVALALRRILQTRGRPLYGSGACARSAGTVAFCLLSLAVVLGHPRATASAIACFGVLGALAAIFGMRSLGANRYRITWRR